MNFSSVFERRTQPNPKTCKVFLLYRIASWIIASVKHFCLTDSQYLSCKNVEKASYTKNILYIILIWGDSLHLKTNNRQRKPGYLFNPYTDLKIRNHPKNQPNHFDTHFDKIQQNQAFSPLFTPSKITSYHPKITSKPYKIRLQSNSTKNHTQSTKFHLTNHQKSNLKITQNTSKINTFTLQHKSKFHSSIEVQKFITS